MKKNRLGASKLLPLVLILVFGGASLLFVMYRAAGSRAKRAATQEEEIKGQRKAEMTEEQRIEYVKNFVQVNDLQLVPDTKPDSEEPVPGLFRVSGIVINKGEEKVDRIILSVLPESANGEVLGAYIENIAGPKGLEPGAARDFKFQVPEKKEYGGRFRHTVK